MQDEFNNRGKGNDLSNQAGSSDSGTGLDFFIGRPRNRRSAASRVFFAIFLIAAGTLLFLGNIGILPIEDIWSYWPLILAAIGFARLFSCRSVTGALTGIFLILFGGLFLLVSLGIFHVNPHDRSWPIALLLITFGFLALARTLDSNRGPRFRVRFPTSRAAPADNALNERVVFGGVKRRVETTDFVGGQVECVFGGVEVDLRRAIMPITANQAIVNIHCVFGGVKIRIPDAWRVSIQGVGIFGTYEDKTIPPAAGEKFEAPSLIITGNSVFSAVEIEN